MPARTVLVLQHIEVERPGLILDALDGSGLDIDIRNLVDRRDVSASDLPRVSDLAGLVVMGGPMNADDLAGHPALELERGLLADALRSGTPTLGVCLGAQLLARAQGLAVRTGAELGRPREIGWSPLYGVDRDDPVVGPLADAPAVLHWHGDRIVPAPGTRVLARTDTTRCQAFRAGPAAWGLQFHLEVTPSLLDDWLTETSFATEARDTLGPDAVARLSADARAAAPALRPLAERSLTHLRNLFVERANL
ncbi:type 1 glutamine amidotransferase [Streptomyces sp. NBC_01724]|nr:MULTISPECIES: type 1 glutamine amidotransferase [unclassified Streptomyces]WTE56651.1 type 1 glutamine amidotransferase [Streptomyces sp. NBC_01620]WTE57402.1 type 1 glutamine amidotransferase [Streptomyces sp. NBC_01617]WTI84911.1 type 1 glutamine amidotransferase [Streptomyces sp. NBC_00724]WNO62435.1 type 1 glutamine amidotransferase [Streptomyces sp. AM2-3-1]WNO69511.1 type 1 glutamine amidotransferase [Streptomyces sp. AM2-3-1]